MSGSVAATVAYTESGAAGTTHQKDISSLSVVTNDLVVVIAAFHAAAPVYPSIIVPSVDGDVEIVRVGAPVASGSTIGLAAWMLRAGQNLASLTLTTPTAMGVAFRAWKLAGSRFGFDGGLGRGSGSSTAPTSTPQTPAYQTGLSFGALAAGASTTFTSPTFTTGAATARQKDSSSTTSSVVDLESGYRTQSNTTAQAYGATISSQAWAALSFTIPASDRAAVMADPGVAKWKRGHLVVPDTGQLWPRGVAASVV